MHQLQLLHAVATAVTCSCYCRYMQLLTLLQLLHAAAKVVTCSCYYYQMQRLRMLDAAVALLHADAACFNGADAASSPVMNIREVNIGLSRAMNLPLLTFPRAIINEGNALYA